MDIPKSTSITTNMTIKLNLVTWIRVGEIFHTTSICHSWQIALSFKLNIIKKLKLHFKLWLDILICVELRCMSSCRLMWFDHLRYFQPVFLVQDFYFSYNNSPYCLPSFGQNWSRMAVYWCCPWLQETCTPCCLMKMGSICMWPWKITCCLPAWMI